MPTKTKTPEPIELHPSVKPLVIPAGVKLSPELAAANDKAREQAERATRINTEATVAIQEAERAGDEDRAAALRAIEENTQFTPTSAEKQERAEHLRTQASMSDRATADAARIVRDAMREDRTYLADREAEEREALDRLREAANTLPSLLADLEQARALARPARRICREAWSGPVFEAPVGEAKLREMIGKARASRGQFNPPPPLEQVLADLMAHVDRAEAELRESA